MLCILCAFFIPFVNANSEYRINDLLRLSQSNLNEDSAKVFSRLRQALHIAQEINNKKQEANVWNALGNAYVHYKDFVAAERSYLRGINVCIDQETDTIKSKIYCNLAVLKQKQGFYQESITFCNQSLTYNPKDSLQHEADIYQTIATSYYTLGLYDLSLKHYFKCLILNEEVKNFPAQAEVANYIGLTYYHLKQFDKALKYYQKSYDLSVSIHHELLKADVLQNIGAFFHRQAKYDSALFYHQKAFTIFRHSNDYDRQINALNGIGLAYMAKGQFPEAKESHTQALKLAERQKDPFNIASCQNYLGQNYYEQKNYRLAIQHFEASLQLADSISALDMTQFICHLLAKCYANLGDYKNAYTYHERYCLTKDSLMERAKNDTIQRIEFQYRQESQKRLARIAQLEQEQKWQRIGFGITFALLIISGAYAVYRRLRLRQERAYQANINATLHSIREGIIGINRSGTIMYFNQAFQNWVHHPNIKLNTPFRVEDFIVDVPTSVKEKFKVFIDDALQGTFNRLNYRLIEDEKIFWYEVDFNPILLVNSQEVNGIVIVVRDVTLEEEHRNLALRYQRSMLEWTIAGQEQERKRIAHDLHDGLAQIISAVAMQLEILRFEVSHVLSFEQIDLLERVIKYAQEATEELRAIAYNLAPHELQESGLIRSLETLCNRVGYIYPIQIEFFTNLNKNITLDNGLSLGLYRITQEALNNVIKHAQAQSVQVDLLIQDNHKLILMISDDGLGFHTQKENTGLGLKTIESRTQLIDGQVEFISNEGGTIVRVEVDLEDYPKS